MLAEVCRVLRPGGWFVGSDSRSSLLFRLIHVGDTLVAVDPDTFGERLERAGFEDVQVQQAARRFRWQARRSPSRDAVHWRQAFGRHSKTGMFRSVSR